MVSALLVKSRIDDLKKSFDASEYGGAPFLGISKPVIKAHGSSDARAIKNAVKQAVFYHNTGIIVDISKKAALPEDVTVSRPRTNTVKSAPKASENEAAKENSEGESK